MDFYFRIKHDALLQNSKTVYIFCEVRVQNVLKAMLPSSKVKRQLKNTSFS